MLTTTLPTKPGVYLWRDSDQIRIGQVKVADSLTSDRQLIFCMIDRQPWCIRSMAGQWLDLAAAIDRIAAMENRLDEVSRDHDIILNDGLQSHWKIIQELQKRLEAVETKTTEQAIRDTVWNQPVISPSWSVPDGNVTVQKHVSGFSLTEPQTQTIGEALSAATTGNTNDLLETCKEVYLALLGHVPDTWRLANQKAYCLLRDSIAKHTGREEREVQEEFESMAINNQVELVKPSGFIAATFPTTESPDGGGQSSLEALAEKWESKSGYFDGDIAKRECAAELRAAMEKIEPSEEEMCIGFAQHDCNNKSVGQAFTIGVMWMLARIKGTQIKSTK